MKTLGLSIASCLTRIIGAAMLWNMVVAPRNGWPAIDLSTAACFALFWSLAAHDLEWSLPSEEKEMRSLNGIVGGSVVMLSAFVGWAIR
jgi:hypothetical protein